MFSDLQPSQQTYGHTIIYNTSTGTPQTGEKWQIAYGEGTAKGVVYADQVTVGSITATSQAVQAATSVSSGFTKDYLFDGVAGLGYPSGNHCKPKKCKTFYSTIAPLLSQPVFTVKLVNGNFGTFTFG